MKVFLDLSSHCVRTAAKSAHEVYVRRALRPGGGKEADIVEIIEALKSFLESADFPLLRSAHPALSGGTHSQVFLETGEHGGISLFLEGEKVYGPMDF